LVAFLLLANGRALVSWQAGQGLQRNSIRSGFLSLASTVQRNGKEVSAGTRKRIRLENSPTEYERTKGKMRMVKKALVLLAVLTLVVFVACKKEETEVNTTDVTATTDTSMTAGTDTGAMSTDTTMTMSTDTSATSTDTTGTSATDTSATSTTSTSTTSTTTT
jgi:hypothetical protein